MLIAEELIDEIGDWLIESRAFMGIATEMTLSLMAEIDADYRTPDWVELTYKEGVANLRYAQDYLERAFKAADPLFNGTDFPSETVVSLRLLMLNHELCLVHTERNLESTREVALANLPAA